MGGDVRPVIPFIAAGFYLRNTPFGITHGKDLWIAHYMQRNPNIAFDDNADDTTDMPNCSFAGMKRRGKATTVFDVTAFGIVPNSSADQTEAIQRVIDAASKAGGGKVYFPKGRYLINTKGDKFLQIKAPPPMLTSPKTIRTSRSKERPTRTDVLWQNLSTAARLRAVIRTRGYRLS